MNCKGCKHEIKENGYCQESNCSCMCWNYQKPTKPMKLTDFGYVDPLG